LFKPQSRKDVHFNVVRFLTLNAGEYTELPWTRLRLKSAALVRSSAARCSLSRKQLCYNRWTKMPLISCLHSTFLVAWNFSFWLEPQREEQFAAVQVFKSSNIDERSGIPTVLVDMRSGCFSIRVVRTSQIFAQSDLCRWSRWRPPTRIRSASWGQGSDRIAFSLMISECLL
jgi:hypothetical protein